MTCHVRNSLGLLTARWLLFCFRAWIWGSLSRNLKDFPQHMVTLFVFLFYLQHAAKSYFPAQSDALLSHHQPTSLSFLEIYSRLTTVPMLFPLQIVNLPAKKSHLLVSTLNIYLRHGPISHEARWFGGDVHMYVPPHCIYIYVSPLNIYLYL